MLVRDGRTIPYHAVSDGTSASCADRDGDGTVGLTGLILRFVSNEGNQATAIITPDNGEIETRGRYAVTFEIVDARGAIVLQEGVLFSIIKK